MTRSINSTFQAHLGDNVLFPLFLLDLQFGVDSLYMHSGIGDLVWNSNTYTGAGNLLSISTINENNSLSAPSVSVTLSGIPAELIAYVLQDVDFGDYGTIYFGLADTNGTIYGEPHQVFKGFIDTADIAKAGREATITVTIQHELSDFERPRERRYNNEDQQIDYPNDRGLEFVDEVQLLNFKWGKD